MKAINRKLLDGVSKTMFNSNNLDMDTFLHTVELVVEDEIRERQDRYKLGETTADMFQSVRKLNPNDVGARRRTDEEIRRMFQTTGVESTQNVTCETNEETNLK